MNAELSSKALSTFSTTAGDEVTKQRLEMTPGQDAKPLALKHLAESIAEQRRVRGAAHHALRHHRMLSQGPQLDLVPPWHQSKQNKKLSD